MKSINRAYKVLNDTYSRRIYDAGLDDESDVEAYFDSDTRSLLHFRYVGAQVWSSG
jgi:hypothetical protein